MFSHSPAEHHTLQREKSVQTYNLLNSETKRKNVLYILYQSKMSYNNTSEFSPCVYNFEVSVFWCFQVRDLSVAYLLVGLTYLYVGVLIFAAFPSPPLSKDCIEPVSVILHFYYVLLFYLFWCAASFAL